MLGKMTECDKDYSDYIEFKSNIVSIDQPPSFVPLQELVSDA